MRSRLAKIGPLTHLCYALAASMALVPLPAAAEEEAPAVEPAAEGETEPKAAVEPTTEAPTDEVEGAAPADKEQPADSEEETPASETAPAADDGPSLDLPEGFDDPASNEAAVAGDDKDDEAARMAELDRMKKDLTRGLRDYRLAMSALTQTTIGGYAEMQLFVPLLNEDQPVTVNFKRMVIFVAHTFTDDIAFYAELEVENAAAGNLTIPGFGQISYPGYVAVEQGFLDWKLLGDALAFRGGMILIPLGIVNQWHEPTIFHGVERPSVERMIIPSTWREAGLGFYGTPFEGLNYEVYLTSGLNPLQFGPARAFAGGRQQMALGQGWGPGLTGRVEYEPILGTVIGAASYASISGPNAINILDTDGQRPDFGELIIPVAGGAFDFRTRMYGFELKTVLASFYIGQSDRLRQVTDLDGNFVGPDVAAGIYGGYLEVAYNLLYFFNTEHQLLPFARLERYDTMAMVEGRQKVAADAAWARTELVTGFSYRPISQVVFKGDYRLLTTDANLSALDHRLAFGIGLMF